MPTGMGGNLAPAAPPSRRIPTLDIVRGVLMTLIITTHMIANSESIGTLPVTIVRSLLSGTVGFVTVS